MCDLELVYRSGECDGRCGRVYVPGDERCLRKIGASSWSKCLGLGHPRAEAKEVGVVGIGRDLLEIAPVGILRDDEALRGMQEMWRREKEAK